MKIKSSAFENNEKIPPKYTCDGEKISPPLAFLDVPVEAKSLVLIVEDPDSTNGTFTHWITWNIPSDSLGIGEGGMAGIEGINSEGIGGYTPPCPICGQHRYFFRLYAVDTTFDLTTTVKRSDLDEKMKGHIVSEARLIGRYGR
ncbi:MAG TPA: YbhB/YbcL family Raf kinase inhibitor-like protein [Patescibacteria group bacterium]